MQLHPSRHHRAEVSGMRGEDMRRWPRLRRWLKWGGLVLSLLIVAAFAASLRWSLRYDRTRLGKPEENGWDDSVSSLALEWGCVHSSRSFQPVYGNSDVWSMKLRRDIDMIWLIKPLFGSGYPGTWYVTLPLWIP